jgi:hypothetical protein
MHIVCGPIDAVGDLFHEGGHTLSPYLQFTAAA